MGYDTISFGDGDDSEMVAKALAENRVILTRDAGIMKRRLITTGRLRAILITSTEPEEQLRQVIQAMNLTDRLTPFTICLECNSALEPRSKEQVKDRVPPYVFRTNTHYMQCPACQRVYWRGTHWEAMVRRLKKLTAG